MQLPRLMSWTVLALALSPCPALATYSIVAADMRTREVGGAGASCVYPSQVSVIFGVAPGFGAVHAQARANTAGRDRAAQLLAMGQAPADIIAAITAASFDASAAQRQYGMVDVMGRSAGYTGAQNSMFADDVQGSVQSYVYSVQGNILTGREVLDQAAAAFEGRGCDLPERLMLALEAGAANGEGDTRCTDPSGIVANSAFIQVDLPGMPAGSYLKLSAGSGRDVDPLPALRSAFNQWRTSHPCAQADAGMAFDAGSVGDAGVSDASAQDASDGRDAAAGDAAGAVVTDAALGMSLDAAVGDASRPPFGSADAASAEAGPVVEAGPAEASVTAPEPQPDSGGCSVRPRAEPAVDVALLLWSSVLSIASARTWRRAIGRRAA